MMKFWLIPNPSIKVVQKIHRNNGGKNEIWFKNYKILKKKKFW